MAAVLHTDSTFAELRPHLTLLSMRDVLSPEDYFILDPHLRPNGHDKVATALMEALQKAGIRAD